MERLLRRMFRRATPGAMFRLALDGLGFFCACTLIWEHFFTIQRSEGPSMYPTFSTRGDYLLISRIHRHGEGIQVGDVVRFYHPSFLGVNGAKRVLGLPGDFVCKDAPFSTGVGEEQEMIQVRASCYVREKIFFFAFFVRLMGCMSLSRFLWVTSFSLETTFLGLEILETMGPSLWVWSMARLLLVSGHLLRFNGLRTLCNLPKSPKNRFPEWKRSEV
jgi:hypothetical protein